MNLYIALLIGLLGVIVSTSGEQLVGGQHTLSGDQLREAEESLKDSLSKLAEGDGEKYKLGEILWAKHQVVSGYLYTYRATLIDEAGETKFCEIEKWVRAWLKDGVQVTFKCEGSPKVVKTHSI